MNSRLESFTKSKSYEADPTLDELTTDLEAIDAFDANAEGNKKKWKIIGIFSLVGSIISFLVADVDATVGFAGLCACGFLLVVSIFNYVTKGNLDTEDRRYQLVQGVLQLISTDIDPQTPLHVRMNLNRPDRPETADGEGKANGWKVKYYRDPWLELRGRFLDGTKFQLLILEKYQRRSKWKRSSSGKQKHKTKVKSASEFMLNLRFKSSKYPNLEPLSDKARKAVRLPHGMLIKNVDLQDGRASLKTVTKNIWNAKPTEDETTNSLNAAHGLASMFLSLYNILTLARETAKRSQTP